MNKVEFINRIAESDAFDTKKAAKVFVDDMLVMIMAEVVAGNDVSLAGFGKFEAYTKENGVVVPKFRPFENFVNQVKAAK